MIGTRRSETEQALTPEIINELTLEGLGTYENVKEDYYLYDICGYERVPRLDTDFGKYKSYNFKMKETSIPVKIEAFQSEQENYGFRLGGATRGTFFSPDEIGKILSHSGIKYTDAPGTDKLESALICKKYGLKHTIYAPGYGMQLYYLKNEEEEFCKAYIKELEYQKKYLTKLGQFTGEDYIDDPEQLWITLGVMFDDSPLTSFITKCLEDFAAVNKEFREEHGFNLPLGSSVSSYDKAKRIVFWKWINRKWTRLVTLKGEMIKKYYKGTFITNVEFDTPADYVMLGKTFDHPGTNTRPGLLDSKFGWNHYSRYATRLIKDLVGKDPMVSVRINNAAAGMRIVPTPDTVRAWYSQAAQAGCWGYYIWLQDFKSVQNDPCGYSGLCYGNPDESTLPKLRWETSLEIANELSRTPRFLPPNPEVGILVNMGSCLIGGWSKVFSAYIELVEAGVWSGFVSDDQILNGDKTFNDYKMLVIPAAEFVEEKLCEMLFNYISNGGLIVCTDPMGFSYLANGEECRKYRALLFGINNMNEANCQESALLCRSDFVVDILPYGKRFVLELNNDGESIGFYKDGSVGLTRNKVGSGESYFFGAGLSDIWSMRKLAEKSEDRGRYKFFNYLVSRCNGIDYSWIYNLRLEDLTKGIKGSPIINKQVDESISFKYWMYEHANPSAMWAHEPNKDS
ncbi:MAG: hypothetical protein VR72_13420 [Clostridiaceae bacterium BRH_c20a]|nr:MAG: hypothetical protein VR72_13420 [Clostridiaceae bacterium BRH_c20a]